MISILYTVICRIERLETFEEERETDPSVAAEERAERASEEGKNQVLFGLSSATIGNTI